MKYDPFEVGGLIQNIRKDKKYTQSYMAEQLDISVGHYSKLEEGSHGISLDLLFKIMTILEVDANTLLIYGNPGFERVERVIAKIYDLEVTDQNLILDSVEMMVDSFCRTEKKRLVS